LRDEILQQFNQPSDLLISTIKKMDLDFEVLKDETLHTVFMDHIVTTLLENPEVEEEVEKLSDQGFSPSTEIVAELLHLNQKLSIHPFFIEQVSRAKNEAIGSIVGLKNDQIEAVKDVNLEIADEETWSRLVRRSPNELRRNNSKYR
jgi:hypothetical protein